MGSDSTTSFQDGVNSGLQGKRSSHGRTSGPTRRSTKGQWTKEEDDILCRAVEENNGKNWKKIAGFFTDRSDVQCLHRWQKVLNPDLVKGPWSKEEDKMMIELVNKYGPKKWSTIAHHLPGRIGKQCRERWHNHLNPAINKESWTQDEELALIRAHQIYGNKWAELSKFLSGRTDNAIKNHWNGCIKKKLDSYVAAGLVAQFQGQPYVEQFQGQPYVEQLTIPVPTPSLRLQQSSGEENVPKNGSEAEEISECSHGSGIVGFTKSESEKANGEISGCNHGSGNVGYSGNQSTNDIIEKMEEYHITKEPVHGKEQCTNPTSCSEQQFVPIEDINYYIPNISSTLDGSIMHRSFANEHFNHHILHEHNHHHLHEFPNSSLEMRHDFMDSQGKSFVAVQPSTGLSTASSGDSVMGDECLIKHSDIVDLIDCTDSFSYEISDIPEPLDAQVYYPPQSHCHSFLSPSPAPPVDSTPTEYDVEANLLNDVSLGNLEQNLSEFGLSVDMDGCIDEKPDVSDEEKKDAGGLFYEPPRFPTTDLPFFSCDLAQSGSDMQQEYSPLGIRRLMMSSSFKMWDSPSSNDDGSPDGVLKCAAKTFNGTPSILKKRQNDVLSPLSEKRRYKRLAGDFSKEFLSSGISRPFSPVDVMFEETDFLKASCCPVSNDERKPDDDIEDKENISPEVGREKKKIVSVKDGVDVLNVKQYAGILLERNLDDFLFRSPARDELETDRFSGSSGETSRYEEVKQSETGLNQTISSQNVAKFDSRKEDDTHSSVVPPDQPDPSTSLDVGGNTKNFSDFEEFLKFCSTPFKRGIESPFTRRSPWLFNSFTPRTEEFVYLKSPTDKSYDAIGLMKQLSEHTATTFANAHSLLGNESISEEHLKNHDSDRENTPRLSSKILLEAERRILDFSDCGMPVKSECKMVGPVGADATDFSSSSSYLLKECR